MSIFFAAIMVSVISSEGFFQSSGDLKKLLPYSSKSLTLFYFRRFVTAAFFIVFYSSFFLITPTSHVIEENSIPETLVIWITASTSLFFTILFIFTFFTVVFEIFPYTIKRRSRKYDMILIQISAVAFLSVCMQGILSFFLIESHPHYIDPLFLYSPVSAPLYIPLREVHFFLNDPNYSPLLAGKIGIMILLSLASTWCYLKCKPVCLANPFFPTYENIKARREAIDQQSRMDRSTDDMKYLDLWHHAKQNVKRAEELNAFRFDPGPAVLTSHERYKQLQDDSHGWKVGKWYVVSLVFILLVFAGVYTPFLTIAMMVFVLMFMFLGDQGGIYSKFTNRNDTSFRYLLRLLPIGEADLHSIYDLRLNNKFSKEIGLVFIYFLAATLVSFTLAYFSGIKVPHIRYLIITFVIGPFVAYCLSKLLYPLLENDGGKAALSLFALCCVGTAQIIWFGIIYIYNVTFLGYFLFLVINIGCILSGSIGRKDLFDDIYDREDNRNVMARRIGVIGICAILIVSLFNVVIMVDSMEFTEEPYFEEYDNNPLTTNYSNSNVTFTEDVVIHDDITIENCSVHFEDSYLKDLVLYVREEGSLTILNSTLDADFYFHFWSDGKLYMENVVLEDLYGSSHTLRVLGGLVLTGNAVLKNVTIRDSGAMGIYVEDGVLTMEDCIIKDSYEYGLEAIDSTITVNNCTFQGNGENDVTMDDCTAFISNSSFQGKKDEAIAHTGSRVTSEDNTYVEKEKEETSLWLICFIGPMIVIIFIMIPIAIARPLNKRQWKRLEDKYGIKEDWTKEAWEEK